MWFLKKKKKKNNSISETIKKLNNLKGKRIVKNSSEELNGIIRTFLKEEYNLSQSLTIEEMMKELKKKRMNKQAKLDLAAVLIETYEKEYKSKTPFTKEQLKIIINKAKRALEEMSA